MAITTPIVNDPQTTLNNLLATIKAGLIKAGITNPQVDPNSDVYIQAVANANQWAINAQNLTAQANAQMLDTATGDDLTRLAGLLGLTRRAAGPSDGFIQVHAPLGTSTAVPTDAKLTSSSGLLYQVVTGATVQDGYLLEVESVDVGLKTNVAAGQILTWQNAPGFLQPTATVYYALTGGIDAENDTSLRTRAINTISNPPQAWNWRQIADTAESASPFIEHAFVYPVAAGPSTVYVVFTQAATPSNIQNRGITFNSLAWLDGYSAVINGTPAFAQTTVPYAFDTLADGYVSVKNITNDVALQLDIPYPIGAANNGIGGGWLNLQPFPNAAQVSGSGIFAYVSAVSNSTNFTIIASAPSGAVDPALIAGITQVSWVDKSNASGKGWIVQTATVTAFTAGTPTSGHCTYTLTINVPFPTIAVSDYVFPASTNGQAYLDTILASFANLGPGQMSSLQALFPNAYRQPLVQLSNPDVVDGRFLKALVNDNNEVETASFYYNQTGATVSGSPQVSFSVNGLEPPVPSPLPSYGGTTNVGIYVPGQVGWYP